MSQIHMSRTGAKAKVGAIPAGYEGALWIADWPLVAAELAGEIEGHTPAFICGKRVLALNEGARAAGIRLGMSRREAHSCAPDAAALRHQPARDLQAFEAVIRAAQSQIAAMRIGEAGLAFFSARRAATRAGSLRALAENLVDILACDIGIDAHVGFAESSFAALLAARSDSIVPLGAAREFIAPYESEALLHGIFLPSERREAAECLSLLSSLGVRTIGDIYSFGACALYSRFGRIGDVLWQLASCSEAPAGSAHRNVSLPEALRTFEPPLASVEQAAFASRILAEELNEQLRRHGACGGHLHINAQMDDGSEYARVWKIESSNPRDITDRVRWQLGTWIGDGKGHGLRRLYMRMDSLQAGGESSEALWGMRDASKESAHRAFTRLQALAGPDCVIHARMAGGRTPAAHAHCGIWGEALAAAHEDAPWPGALPAPYPSTVHMRARSVKVRCAAGHPLGVDGYGMCMCEGGCEQPEPALYDGQRVRAWAGPWAMEERWWADDGHRRAYLHVAGENGAWLCYVEGGQWYEEGCYG